jgi:hypothetical protein
MAVVAALVITLREANAAPRCKSDGAKCLTNSTCCSGTCLKPAAGRKNVFGVCGVSGSPNGEACNADTQCASGHCADGVCCNTACTGSCLTCDGGTCAPKAAGETCDDGRFCTKTDVCNGSGSCQGSGATCPRESDPDSCTVCDESSDTCEQTGGLACGLGAGQPCSDWSECGSFYCVDGVCCDSACSGYCEACTQAKTGWSDGMCAAVSGFTDPDDECADGLCVTGYCNGQGSCGVIEWGTDPRDECPDDQCVTGMCDGAGGCGVLADYIACNDGVGCSQVDHCDGAGSCVTTGNGCPMRAPSAQCECNESTDTCFYEGAGPCP